MHLECAATGELHPANELHGLSRAGAPLLARYDLSRARRTLDRSTIGARPADMWRFRELLPVRQTGNIVSLGEVPTPIVPFARLGGLLETRHLLMKDEGRLPTGSFKARGIAVAVSMARELGVKKIAMPTNGNAGAALAAYGSRADIETIILCPDDTPDINIREIGVQGGRVYRVNGLIDECGRIVAEGASQGLWFDMSTLKEPYRIEGKKTMGLELAEQFDWTLPDVIFYPTGGGTGLIGMWKAFQELEDVGFIGPARPRMVAVQAEGCAPIVRAFEMGLEHAPRWEGAATLAAGIRVPKAIGDFLILRAVRESGGFAIAVSDEEIVSALGAVAKEEGLLLCPEGAATLAAYVKARERKLVSADERALLFNCASGLKYPMPDLSGVIDRADPGPLEAL